MSDMSESSGQFNPREHPLRIYVPEGYQRVREKEKGLDNFD